MDLVFEIGTEELPAAYQLPAVEFIAAHLKTALTDERLIISYASDSEHAPDSAVSLKTYATPRRLAVVVRNIQAQGDSVAETLSGPPVKVAFDADGKPTKALESFASKKGIAASAFQPSASGKAVASRTLEGKRAVDILPAILEKLIPAIPFRKVMRWGHGDLAFPRPVQWILASLDGALLPLRFGDVASGRTTRGHRFHADVEFSIPSAAGYVEALRAHHVLADWSERRARVWEEVVRAAATGGGEPRPDDELLETVTGLVEEPSGVLGRFEPSFLELPPEVLVSEMRGHQKYFAVRDPATHKLLPAFVAVSNTRVDDESVSRRGYERVLRARLSDGRFFFDEDRKATLESRVEKLARITFFQGLGTQRERVLRLGQLAGWLAELTGKGDRAVIEEAAHLCKADLTTGMVSEFPDLQGTMGRVYALHDGKGARVADAIFEHYLPRGADDGLPAGDEGALLGLADRLDQLTGFFGLGKEPSGTADPYGLRRAAIGLIRLISARGYRLDLGQAIAQAQRLHGAQQAAGAQEKRVSQEPALVEKVWSFLAGRFEALQREKAATDAVQAVLATGSRDLVSLEKRLAALASVRETQKGHFEATAAAFKRIGNILSQAREKKLAPMAFDPALIPEGGAAERALAEALSTGRARVAQALSDGEDYPAAYVVLAELRPAVDRFFDAVMVMDPDERLRDNRLALLRALHELFAPLADFARIQSA